MSEEKQPRAGAASFKPIARKSVKVSQAELITTHTAEDSPLPLIVEPNVERVNLVTWAQSHRPWIDAQLLRHGGLLFRGFELPSERTIETFIQATSSGALEYSERSSPRSQVSGNIYTSTDHPADQSIFLHNEQSYNRVFPLKIFFACMLPAQQGGGTPLSDSRRVYEAIDPAIRMRFAAKGYMYVRNFGDGFGLAWQAAFQTEDPAAVEAYCRSNDIAFEWKGQNRLRTRQVRPAIARHPYSGDLAWFNHITFFHISTLEPALRATLLDTFGEEDLPNNTYYGDGTPIESSIMDELRAVYRAATVVAPWQRGDLLMLDNMLAAHGREPFVGPRKVLVGMADPCEWSDVAVMQ